MVNPPLVPIKGKYLRTLMGKVSYFFVRRLSSRLLLPRSLAYAHPFPERLATHVFGKFQSFCSFPRFAIVLMCFLACARGRHNPL